MTPKEQMQAVHDALVAEKLHVGRLIVKSPNERSYFTLEKRDEDTDIGKDGVWRIRGHHLKSDTLTVDLSITETGMNERHRRGSLAAAVMFVSHFIERDPVPQVPILELGLPHADKRGSLGDRYSLDVTGNSVEDIVSMFRELHQKKWPAV
jgi:hypothetical protein